MSKNEGGRAVRTIGMMAVIIFLAKFMGLFRETLIAGIYGQGMESDIINSATQIPLLFFDMVLGVAILSTFVPIFNKYLEKSGKERAMEFAYNFTSTIGLVAVIFSALGVIFAKPLVHLIAPGYASVPGKAEQTANLLCILFPSIAFTGIAYIAVGILQSFGEFLVPSLISVVSNGIMILYLMIFGNRFGLVGVADSMLLAWVLQLVVQLPWLKKFGFKYRFKINLRDPGLKEAAILALPVLISSWVQPICNVINISFGSSLGDGAVSALNWGNKIYIIMVGVFAYAITNFIFPKLSRLSGSDSEKDFAEATRTSVGWIVFIIALVSALFIALSKPIIAVVFQRGAFDKNSTVITATALFYYSFGMIGYAICEVLNKSFYAIRDGRTPMYTSILGIVVNFIAAVFFVKVFDMSIGGLALAGAVSSISIACALLYMINKRRRGILNKSFFFNILKILLCGVLACIAAYLVFGFIDDLMGDTMLYNLIKLCISALPATLVYLAFGYVFKVKEITEIIKFVRERKVQ